MNVVINILGERCTHGAKPQRWSQWRPTIAVCSQPEFIVHRLVLLHTEQQRKHLPTICADLKAVSPETEVELVALPSHRTGDLVETYNVLRTFAAGYRINPENNQYFVHTTPAHQIEQLCLLKLTESRHFPAELLQTHPPTGDDFIGSVSVQAIQLEPQEEPQLSPSKSSGALHQKLIPPGMSLVSNFTETLDQIASAALLTTEPIFICGPMGVGKSTLAKRLHHFLSAERKVQGPFQEIDCAAQLPEKITDYLFGTNGVLASQAPGVLYLDAIEELQPVAQVNLLRTIENKSFLSVDTSKNVPLNTRILLGSRTNLSAAVKAGRFRQDLWLRISAWQFDIPPVRERYSDLEPAVEFALLEHMRKIGRRVQFAPEAKSQFLKFAQTPQAKWPGNFRDIEMSVYRLATLAQLGTIQLNAVEREIHRLTNLWQETSDGPSSLLLEQYLAFDVRMTLDRFESVQLADVISVCLNSKTLSDAGRNLFSESRKKKRKANDADRLRKYLQKYDLDWSSFHN
ncbi:MAG: RNA repair transcriptional activator RtcR family protein [Myxococcota bacterium]|nr:RNA repair transcriptional activator RtcR family protein [Myxococcota bacterium]